MIKKRSKEPETKQTESKEEPKEPEVATKNQRNRMLKKMTKRI